MKKFLRSLLKSKTTLLLMSFFSLSTFIQAQTTNNLSNKEAILLIAFGSSEKSNAKKAYDNIEQNIKKQFPNHQLYWAYTSKFIREKYAKQNIRKYSITEALEVINNAGYKKITAQSLHVTNGAEYNEMLNELAIFKSKNSDFIINVGLPLLVSKNDLQLFSTAMLENLKQANIKKDSSVIFIGHGNHHGIGDMTFIALENYLQKINSNYFVTLVEGIQGFEETVNKAKIQNIKSTYLVPLLLTCGVHVKEDVVGEEAGSLQNLLEAKKIISHPILKGLGEYDNIVDIFAEHIKAAQPLKLK
ncbi:sirohydrochlorin cobaltochelatase [Lentisphaerota bacterium WC36G]|nr:sirohydrochlorin cobaltochelatase [Lentisphaerae bacterium WC36]